MPRASSIQQARRCPKAADDCPEELRSWEWHVLLRQCYDQQPPALEVGDGISSLSVSDNGERVAVGLDNGTVVIWDRLLELQRSIQAHDNPPSWMLANWIALSPDGTLLAATSDDNTVRIWNATTKQLIQELRLDSAVDSVAFDREGKRLVCAGEGGVVTIWDLENVEQPSNTFSTDVTWLWTAAFSPREGSVATGSSNGQFFLWNENTNDVGQWALARRAN